MTILVSLPVGHGRRGFVCAIGSKQHRLEAFGLRTPQRRNANLYTGALGTRGAIGQATRYLTRRPCGHDPFAMAD